jgi:predicted transcriptional regulator
MSFIIRIAVLCLLLAAIPCIAVASDSGDQSHGHDTGDASGSDHSAVDSGGTSDSGGTPDSGETRDPGEKNADWDSAPSSLQGSYGPQDQPAREDAALSGKENELIDPEGSAKESSPHQKNDAEDASQKTSSQGREEENIPHQGGDREQSPDIRDIASGRPDREMHDEDSGKDEDSEKDLPGTNENRMGEKETEYSAVMHGRIVSTLSGDNDGTPGDPDGEKPFTSSGQVPYDTRSAAGHPPAHQIPERAPASEVPYANLPVFPAGGPPIGSATGSADGTRSLVRSKNKDEHEPFWSPTDSTFVLSPWMLLKLWCFLGFRRVLRKNVLESDERRGLYESITENPGVDLSSLTEMLRLNKETARYHLKMLAANGKISGLIKQGIARYFPSREMISEFEKTVIHYLWIGTTKRILLLLIETPGLTRQAIADELGIAGPSVTWQMQRLADDGLIEVRTEGRFVRYFLTPDSSEVLESVKKPEGLAGRGIT